MRRSFGLPDREREGCTEDQAEDQHGGRNRLDTNPLHQQRGDSKKNRPEQENLALNGQGPEVQEGRLTAGVRGEVVHRVVLQVPVLPVEQGGLRVHGTVSPDGRREHQEATGEGQQNHDRRCGQQAVDVRPVVQELEGLPSLIFRMKESESRNAEMKRKTSTPPETLPTHTW